MILLTLLAGYCAPALFAVARGHRGRAEIRAGNLFLGWTVVGWFWFLALALGSADASLGTGRALAPAEASLQTALRAARGGAPELRQLAELGEHQLLLLHDLAAAITVILDGKLRQGELTRFRYQQGAEVLREAILGRLALTAALLRSLAALDREQLAARLHAGRGAEDDRSPLGARARLRADQQRRAGALLTRNEGALTRLSKLTAALAETNLAGGRIPVELDAAELQVEQLLERVRSYDPAPIAWEALPPEAERRG